MPLVMPLDSPLRLAMLKHRKKNIEANNLKLAKTAKDIDWEWFEEYMTNVWKLRYIWEEYKMKKSILFCIIGIIVLSGCAYTPRVDYVKDVTAYPEGDGIVVYFILADATGQMVKAKGHGSLNVYLITTRWEGYNLVDKETLLFKDDFEVQLSDFVQTTVGLGSFEHDALILPYGRLSYSGLRINPQRADFGFMSLKIGFEFQEESGKTVRGRTTTIVS